MVAGLVSLGLRDAGWARALPGHGRGWGRGWGGMGLGWWQVGGWGLRWGGCCSGLASRWSGCMGGDWVGGVALAGGPDPREV